MRAMGFDKVHAICQFQENCRYSQQGKTKDCGGEKKLIPNLFHRCLPESGQR